MPAGFQVIRSIALGAGQCTVTRQLTGLLAGEPLVRALMAAGSASNSPSTSWRVRRDGRMSWSMSSVPDQVFRAWRPRDFLARVLSLAALDVALSLGLVSLAV